MDYIHKISSEELLQALESSASITNRCLGRSLDVDNAYKYALFRATCDLILEMSLRPHEWSLAIRVYRNSRRPVVYRISGHSYHCEFSPSYIHHFCMDRITDLTFDIHTRYSNGEALEWAQAPFTVTSLEVARSAVCGSSLPHDVRKSLFGS